MPTSEVNMLAQVPMHQATIGFLTLPVFTASIILYSSVPPTFDKQIYEIHRHFTLTNNFQGNTAHPYGKKWCYKPLQEQLSF